ncbi:hypothetical protein [Edaphobacter bradus]|nr:hypothetical protein [Edaphobacter bradus]
MSNSKPPRKGVPGIAQDAAHIKTPPKPAGNAATKVNPPNKGK